MRPWAHKAHSATSNLDTPDDLKIRSLIFGVEKHNRLRTDRRTDNPADHPTDRREHPHIEMRGLVQKSFLVAMISANSERNKAAHVRRIVRPSSIFPVESELHKFVAECG